MSSTLRIATRKSELALWQTEDVQRRLASHAISSDLVKMSTQGDEILDQPLAKIGGKGLFVKNLQRAMLRGDADLAVHSMKDMPADFPDGLHLGAVLDREDPTDCLVSNRYKSLQELPKGAVVGTCSLMRQCQLLEIRPDLVVRSLRGNLNTRLKKLDAGDYDAIVLSSAGLIRLGWQERMTERLPTELMLPACGQGIVGIECRNDDTTTNAAVTLLHSTDSSDRVTAERTLNCRLGGSCTTPIGAYTDIQDEYLLLSGLVGLPDGTSVLRASERAHRHEAVELGNAVAGQLLSMGGDKIIDQFNAYGAGSPSGVPVAPGR